VTFAAVLCVATPCAQAQTAVCPAAGTETATLADVTPDLDLVLSDGRRVALAGLEPPQATVARPDFAQEARAALLGWLNGKSIALARLRDGEDRWGRIVAYAFGPNAAGAPVTPVAAALLDAGWGRARPQADARACLSALLRAETAARAQRLGVWADPAYAVLVAGDPASFAQRAGDWVVVEGRVQSVNETAARVYLNFGARRGIDFTATVGRQNRRLFERAGMALKAFSGKTIRVRGLLETRGGPHIDIDLPEALERADGG
jgi:micrococcal nuclease